MPDTIKLGVSACLLGEKVRYDGGHKQFRYLTDVLSDRFIFVPVCPEVGCGLPVPREAMRLTGDPAALRLIVIRSGIDMTERMLSYCRRTVAALEAEKLCGFIFKKGSPSSGLFRVRVYSDAGMPAGTGRGLFARAVAEHYPFLPVEEEERLEDASLRENFLERVFAYKRLQDFLDEDGTIDGLVSFHTRHRLQLMAHHPALYRKTGRLVAAAGDMARDELLESYRRLFMTTLGYQATVRKNTDVLQHIMGYLKKDLTADENNELKKAIGRYRSRLVPLAVPLTLVKHYLRNIKARDLTGQTYLEPHPAELMLRNRV